MKGLTILKRSVFANLVLLIGFYGNALAFQGSPEFHRYFSGLGSGTAGQIAFRTQVELTNDSEEEVSIELNLFTGKGEPWPASWTRQPSDLEAGFEVEEGKVTAVVPPLSTLVLTLEPSDAGRLGWMALSASAELGVSASLQVANLPASKTPAPEAFEHYIERVSEVIPVEGSKSFTFPIWYFSGLKQVGTAFSVANVSGAVADVTLSLRGGETRTIRLEPGEVLADYFDLFWQLAFPEIFPFELRTAAQVESKSPLAFNVYRTLDGLPVSGVPGHSLQVSEVPVEAQIDQDVELKVGDRAQLSGSQLELLFWTVVSDSRCATDVVCVWEGEATVEFRVYSEGRETGKVQLSTEPEKNRAQVEDFILELLSIAPEPVSTQTIEIGEYRILLRISRAEQ